MTPDDAGHPDALAWLESGTDERTRRWVSDESRRVVDAYPESLTRTLQTELQQAMLGRLNVTPPTQSGGWCYRYDAHDRTWLRSRASVVGRLGAWQPTRFESPEVDDALAADLLPCPFPARGAGAEPAMVTVTHEGTDATSSWEVDLSHGVAVPDGLRVPALVHQLSWDGPDALLVSHRHQHPTGFQWVVDRLRRGASWSEATRLHSFPPDRVAASITRDPTSSTYLMIEWLDHRRRVYHLGAETDGAITWDRVPVPDHVRFQLLGELALLVPLLPWRVDEDSDAVPVGSLLAAPVAELLEGTATPRVVHRVGDGERMLSLAVSRSRALVSIRDRDSTRLLAVDPYGSRTHEVARTDASTRVRASPIDPVDDDCADAFWVESAGPVTPPQLTYVDASRPGSGHVVESGRATFRHGDFAVQHHRVDPGSVPAVEFTVVRPRDLPLDGETPTVLTGYGAFSVPGHLDYLDLTGPSWLDRVTSDGRRCAYVFAHVGAGLTQLSEPWERLSGSVSQFLAVAGRLAELGIARPERLGVLGVSHGGLLVMNAVLDRPSAFGAVVCRSAVLDLLGYPRLDGTAWTTEYGDPRDAAVRPALERVSPYHRVSDGGECPPVLLWSASNDDRVSPAHSRRMAARLRAAGADALYLETQGGGHDPLAATPVGAHGLAVTASFFWRHLAEEPRGGRAENFRTAS